MPVRDAVQAIRAANADMKAYPVDIARLDALPQTELTASVFAPTSGFDESRRQNFRGQPRADLPNTKVHGQLKGGYSLRQQRSGSLQGVCASHSVIHVLYGTSTAPGQPRNLVSELKINAANHQLEYGGIEASHRMLLEASGQRDQQRAQEASARSGPKL
jgi:hypothetical protein